MLFHQPVKDIIRQRKSIRSYLGTSIEEEKKKALIYFLSANTTGPLGSQARFTFITASREDRSALKGLMTYGVIKSPMGFIIGAVGNTPYSLEDFGYLMEKGILMATDLGLGTCWLGGTFNSSGFARKIALKDNETIPAVTSAGYAVPKLSPVDSLVRSSAGADKRKPWNALFFKSGQPLPAGEAGPYATALEMVRLAPSANNFQPWRIIKDAKDDTYHFYIKRVPGLKFFMKSDLQRVDLGIAMCHFALAADEEGLKGSWHIHDPRLGGIADKLDYKVTWVGSK